MEEYDSDPLQCIDPFIPGHLAAFRTARTVTPGPSSFVPSEQHADPEAAGHKLRAIRTPSPAPSSFVTHEQHADPEAAAPKAKRQKSPRQQAANRMYSQKKAQEARDNKAELAMLKLQAPEEPRYIGPVPPLSRGEELAVPRRGQLPLLLTKDVLRGMPLHADEGCPRSDGFAGVWQLCVEALGERLEKSEAVQEVMSIVHRVISTIVTCKATADVTEDQHWAALLIYTSFCDQVAVVEHSLTEAVQKLAEAVALVDQLRNKEGGMVRQSDPGVLARTTAIDAVNKLEGDLRATTVVLCNALTHGVYNTEQSAEGIVSMWPAAPDPQVFLRESLTDLRDHFAQGTHGLQDTMLSWGQVLSYVDSIDIKRDADRYVPIDPFLSKRAA